MSILGDIWNYVFNREDYDLEPFRHPSVGDKGTTSESGGFFYQSNEPEMTLRRASFLEFCKYLDEIQTSVPDFMREKLDDLHGDWKVDQGKIDPSSLPHEYKVQLFDAFWNEAHQPTVDEENTVEADWHYA